MRGFRDEPQALLAPLVPGHIGCIVIRPDAAGLARAVPDPLA